MDLINMLLGGAASLPIVVLILKYLVIINGCLSALSAALNKLKEYAILKDGAFFNSLAKASALLQKIVDFLSANQAHPQPAAKQEVK